MQFCIYLLFTFVIFLESNNCVVTQATKGTESQKWRN